MDPETEEYKEKNMAFCRALTYWRDLEKRYISRQLMETLCSTKETELIITERSAPEIETGEVETTELAEIPFHIKYHGNGQELFRVWMYSSFILVIILIILIFGNNLFSMWSCTSCIEPCQQECQKYMSGNFWVEQASQFFMDDEFVL